VLTVRVGTIRAQSDTFGLTSASGRCLPVVEAPLTSPPSHLQRRTFERLLQDAAFPLKDGMAAGLLLRADLEAVLRDDGAGGVRADLSAEPQLRVGNAIGPARLRLSGVTVLRSSDFKRLIAMLNLTMRRF
jgi:hypothetical protein